jgi:hypothetical protein
MKVRVDIGDDGEAVGHRDLRSTEGGARPLSVHLSATIHTPEATRRHPCGGLSGQDPSWPRRSYPTEGGLSQRCRIAIRNRRMGRSVRGGEGREGKEAVVKAGGAGGATAAA